MNDNARKSGIGSGVGEGTKAAEGVVSDDGNAKGVGKEGVTEMDVDKIKGTDSSSLLQGSAGAHFRISHHSVKFVFQMKMEMELKVLLPTRRLRLRKVRVKYRWRIRRVRL